MQNRKLAISILASFILASVASADTQTINYQKGWNLLGSNLKVLVTDNAFKNVKTIWGWEASNQKWKAFSADENIKNIITTLVQQGKLENLYLLKPGMGFWLNSDTKGSLTLNGSAATNKTLILSRGWNLVSFIGDEEEDINKVFQNNGQIYVVWSWENGKWSAWSPSSYIRSLIKNKNIDLLTKIKPSKGYWVKTQMATTLPLDLTPPAVKKIIFVRLLTDNQTVVPASGVDLFVDNKKIGTTDEKGFLDISNLDLPDGTVVVASKEGMTTTRGVIKNGSLVLTLAPEQTGVNVNETNTTYTSSRILAKINQASAVIKGGSEGSELSISNLVSLTPVGGTITFSGSSSKSSVTVFTTMYNYPSQLPPITNKIKVGDEVVEPKELSFIGGANISLKDEKGNNIIDLTEYDNTGLSYQVELDRFIGDFNKILTGLTGTTLEEKQKFTEEVYNKFMQAKQKGLVDFYFIQQQADGSWKFVDKAKFVKLPDGKFIMKPEHDIKLTTFGGGNVAYVIRTKAVTGTTKVCLTDDGERMFDGKILTDVTNYGKPIKGAIIVGDSHIIEQPAPTGEDGCTNVKYKVPFLSPMYQFTAVKEGYYNKPITVEIEFGNLNKPLDKNQSKMLEKPNDVSIKGYVKSIYNGRIEPEDDAIVTLRDPQILVPGKVVVNDEEGNKSITLVKDPNLVYTWTLTKENSDKKVVIKSGKADDGANELTEKEIENIIYSNDPNKNPWYKHPYGHYTLYVKVEHKYSNTNEEFVETMMIGFDAKIDEPALMHAFYNSTNQGDAPTYKIYSDGTRELVELNTSTNPPISKELAEQKIGIWSIFGGKDLGRFEPLQRPADPSITTYISAPDESNWTTDVLSYTKDDCMDTTKEDNPYYEKLEEAGKSAGYCIKRLAPKFSYDYQFMPFAQVYKEFMDYFPTITAPDTANNNKPYYQSGFTVMNTYHPVYVRGDVNYTSYVVSYTSLKEDALKSVDDFSNILNFAPVPNEAIAFNARVVKTDKDGSYRIDHITPNIIPYVELMARAAGTKYNTKNFRKTDYPDAVYSAEDSNTTPDIVETPTQGIKYDNPKPGDVLVHNFLLDRIAPSEIKIGFENNLTDNEGRVWQIKKLEIENSYINAGVSDTAIWHVVDNNNLPQTNEDYRKTFEEYYDLVDVPKTILPAISGNKYAWVGDLSTGTYSDSGHQNSNHNVATALVSPIIDFSNYSLATLQFKTWFEVSAQDAAWDTAFVGFEIVDDNATEGSTIPLTYYNGFTWYVKAHQTYIHRLTPTTPIQSDYDFKLFSNNGFGLPSWTTYKLPLDFLAGHKARIVLGFFTADNLYNNYRGWGVDDISIKDNVDYVITTPPMPQSFDDEIAPANEGNTTLITPENNTTSAQ
jgi:hypothetical protein